MLRKPLHASISSCVLACTLLAAIAQAQPVTIYRCTDPAGDLTVQNQPCPAGSTQREQQMQGVAASPVATGTLPVPRQAATPAPAPSAPDMPVQSTGRSSDGGFVTTSTGPGPGRTDGSGYPGSPAAQDMPRSADGGFITTSIGPEPRILDSANLPRTLPVPDEGLAADPDRPPPPPLFRCATWDGDSYLSEDEEVPPRCLPLRTVGLDGNPATGAGRACEVVRDQCSRVADGGACEAWRRYAREAESRLRFAHPDNVERRRGEYERLAGIVAASCGS